MADSTIWTKSLGAVGALAALALAGHAAGAPAPDKLAAWTALPDWSGVWAMQGGTVFDRATVTPPNAQAGITMGAREHPALTPQYEALYQKNIKGVEDGTFPDPLTFCGIPAGMPRMVNQPDGYEWVITPKQVWEVTENATGIRRIYTDGRAHPQGDDLLNQYTGHNVGHWEGDTLVIDTVGMKAESIIDRTGLQLSDKRHVTERIRKIDDNTLEDQITIDDPVALTAPWHVVKRFRKQPAGTYIFDYACAENNRSPIGANGHTTIRDAAGHVISN